MSSAEIRIIEVTDAGGRVAAPAWLARAESVHRQLRNFTEDYAAKLDRVFAGGARMAVAVRGESVVGVALWRIYENTYAGTQLYVDDLVTDEQQRSGGVGHALLAWLESTARRSGCDTLALDSGTQRRRAHAFYFRERMEINAFHFGKALR